jgi:hypothetical protein
VISSSQRPLPDGMQHLQQTNVHVSGGIGTRNLSRRAAADLQTARPLGPAAYFQLLTVAESRRRSQTKFYAFVGIKLLCIFSIAVGPISLPSFTS